MAPKDARFKSKDDFAYNTGNGYLGTFKRYGKLNSFKKKGIPAYNICVARTKLALWLWTSEYQRRLIAEGSNIIVICAHPGGVLTREFAVHVHHTRVNFT